MRHFHALLLLGSSVLGTAASASPAPAIPPILTGAPSAAAINARCNMFVTRSKAMRTALEKSKAKPGVETTLRAYDNLNRLLADAGSEALFYREVQTSPASRTAGEKCEVAISSELTKLQLSRPIYEHLKAVQPAADDAQTKLYLTRTLGAFERAGIGLDAAGRAKAQALAD